MSKINVGVIGTGMMGKNHIRIYRELKSVDSVYIFDTNTSAAIDIESQYDDVFACKNLNTLVDVADIASVCVPTQFHSSTVMNVLNINEHLPLLIEKPICSSTMEAITLSNELNEDILYGVGHIERFNPIIPEIKKIIGSEKPLYVEFKRHNPSSARMQNTNVVEDLMIHDIDIMRELFTKKPTALYGMGNLDVYSAMIVDKTTPIYLSASRKGCKKIRSVYIEMPTFTIEGDYMSQEIIIHSKPDRFKLDNEKYTQENVVEKVIVNKKEPLREELQSFINCFISNTKFQVSVDDAINNMMMCDQILRNQIVSW